MGSQKRHHMLALRAEKEQHERIHGLHCEHTSWQTKHKGLVGSGLKRLNALHNILSGVLARLCRIRGDKETHISSRISS